MPFNALVLPSISIDWFAIRWSCSLHGGVSSPTMIWILIIAILAIFPIGGQRGLEPWLAVLLPAACFLAFLALPTVLGPPENGIPASALTVLGVVSVAGVLRCVAGMAFHHAKIFDAGVDLETEVRRREAMAVELRAAIARAERAGAARSEFLARMSHEPRDPLNAIIGYGEFPKDEAKDDRDELFGREVERILDAGCSLPRLIDMILDPSRMEAHARSAEGRGSTLTVTLPTGPDEAMPVPAQAA